MTGVEFWVSGTPATQGSKTGYVRGGRAIVVDKNPATLKPWREAVRQDAMAAAFAVWGNGYAPLDGPVTVLIAFALKQPASAPKRRRTWPIGARSGDLDKLTRACLDAITDAGIWRDDSQVVNLHCTKDYAPEGRVGARITVETEGDQIL